ncbi:NAD(P)-dependent alcohol dehydrogenase [Parerythrobacter jejuensis]|uniref:Alcohol dehydrogenase catalytic domain-containing protein n=1 Tax=Parerythrobacter jejuensis TaxID=795812 RepID=A0A845AXA3_9SPHN|nr:NAD(P)-dependent alcohol dehydrogenase [Parerythrobacter jejuensis]MXP30376.1 alcohol dehydrogenase catalytic domain-containing protein [Parerythrobacter jejuensis]MXP33136.1 alcohol dehydrogenase catalytic domain-containing protein [Parerythrobacter jejuensis]
MATQTNEYPTKAYGATAPDSGLAPMDITRRGLRDDDVLIDISHCGICHSDLHTARNDWGRTTYPVVPGHEIVGTVAAVGDAVSRHKVGDRVAIGCMVDSCKQCAHCEMDLEQYCKQGMVGTYGGRDRHDGSTTHGGYSERIVCRDEFVLKVPDALSSEHAAPLLCAGITTYSPLRQWNVGPGSKVAVAGLGGLGHMGVKFAVAMGAEVTVLSRSESKRQDAMDLGAHDFLITTDREAMKAKTGYFDLVLNTVPVRHDVTPYLHLLRIDGAQVLVGVIDKLPELHSGILLGRKILSGSGIGGIAETQDMLDLCAEKAIVPEIEMIRMEEVNTAYDRMEASDVKYRFVIDMGAFRGA